MRCFAYSSLTLLQVGKGLELEGEYTLALLEILTRQRVSHLWTVSLRIKIRPEFFDPQHLVNCGDQILHGTSLEREIDRHSEDFCHRELLKNPGEGTRYIPGWGGAARPLIP